MCNVGYKLAMDAQNCLGKKVAKTSPFRKLAFLTVRKRKDDGTRTPFSCRFKQYEEGLSVESDQSGSYFR